MKYYFEPTLLKNKFFTKSIVLLSVIALAGLAVLLYRLIYGIGAVTNLTNNNPWGIWIGLDVAAGVALAAGGFTTAAIGHIFHKDKYEVFVRPALLTALLGYTFVALSVSIDLGRWYYIWHPLIMWNGNSALFEVGICVMFYLTVLYIEFLPIVTERFIGKVNLGNRLAFLNKPIDKLLRKLDRGLSKTMFIFIIAGVVLSCLHQSSLGTLMIIAGSKIHPLWQTPVLPLLFLLSAFSVGFPMVIFESLITSKSFKLKPELHHLADLSKYVVPLLGIYLAFKIGDMFIRETFVYLTEVTKESILFYCEIIFGIIIPIRLFLSEAVRKSATGLTISSLLVVLGIALNRFNVFITSYTSPYQTEAYLPSIGEILLTLGFVALEVLIFRFVIIHFPIVSKQKVNTTNDAKFTIKGV